MRLRLRSLAVGVLFPFVRSHLPADEPQRVGRREARPVAGLPLRSLRLLRARHQPGKASGQHLSLFHHLRQQLHLAHRILQALVSAVVVVSCRAHVRVRMGERACTGRTSDRATLLHSAYLGVEHQQEPTVGWRDPRLRRECAAGVSGRDEREGASGQCTSWRAVGRLGGRSVRVEGKGGVGGGGGGGGRLGASSGLGYVV